MKRAPLKNKGVIHPASFSEGFILDPDEDLTNVNVGQLQRKVQILEKTMKRIYKASGNWDEIKELKKEHKNISELIKRKERYDLWLTDNDTHGSSVTEAAHLVTPGAQFLLFDLNGPYWDPKAAWDTKVAYSIRKAVQHGVDVINMSFGFLGSCRMTDEIVKACQEASFKGIPIIFSAGNDSYKKENKRYNISINHKVETHATGKEFIRNDKQDLFKRLAGQGLRFAGALKYSKNGVEKVATYSTLPSNKTQKHFLFAAGSKLPIHDTTDPNTLAEGSSFAASTIAAGYLLLKQYLLEMGYQISPDGLLYNPYLLEKGEDQIFYDDILEYMYESGRDVRAFGPGVINIPNSNVFDSTYKAMDLVSAIRYLDEMVKVSMGNPIPKFAMGSVASPIAISPARFFWKKVSGEPLPKLAIHPDATPIAIPPLEIQLTEEVNPIKNRRREPLKRTTGTIFNSRPEIKPTVEVNPGKDVKQNSPVLNKKRVPLKRTTGTIFNSRPEIKPAVKVNLSTVVEQVLSHKEQIKLFDKLRGKYQPKHEYRRGIEKILWEYLKAHKVPGEPLPKLRVRPVTPPITLLPLKIQLRENQS